jgi:hypothetical protein
MATAGCAAACLNTAGRGGIIKRGETTNQIQIARLARTDFFFNDREAFMGKLVKEITNAIKLAEKHELTPVFRLNGTSDIRWEHIPATVNGMTYPNVMLAFPTAIFYDYSKIFNRRNLPPNYHLTLSRSETNEAQTIEWLKNGGNVAIVFAVKKGKPLPETWNGYKVIDADDTDLRFLDPVNVVAGLRNKGKAKADASGFVVSVAQM